MILAAVPTMPSAAADYVRPRDRLRHGGLAPGTTGGIGPWYDADPGPAEIPSSHELAPPAAGEAGAVGAPGRGGRRGHGAADAGVRDRVRGAGFRAGHPALGRRSARGAIGDTGRVAAALAACGAGGDRNQC